MTKSYNLLERNLSKALETFPQLKQIAKTAYQYLNYWYYGDRKFKLSLHPDVQILTPNRWSNTDFPTEELFFGYYDKSPWSSDMTKLVYHHLKNLSLIHI